MNILWDPDKNLWLNEHRGISLDEIASCILCRKYKAMLENPSRDGQMIFIIDYKEYIHVVPFVIDENNNIVLKTAFPSRRYQKLYGGGK